MRYQFYVVQPFSLDNDDYDENDDDYIDDANDNDGCLLFRRKLLSITFPL